MYSIVKIEGNNAHNNLQLFLSRQKFLPIFFFSPYTLNTYLAHNGKDLYIIDYKGEETLIMIKEKPKEVRFLFNSPSVHMKEKVLNILGLSMSL